MRVENFLVPFALAGQSLTPALNPDGLPYQESEQVAIYLVRHGETYWNENTEMEDPDGEKVMGPLIQGSTDIELNEKGILQAGQTAEMISGLGFSIDAIYSSPLKRASKTAEIIASKIGLIPIQEPAFAAYSWGAVEGRNREYRQKIYAIDKDANYRGPNWEAMPTRERWSFQPIEGAESLDAVARRMKDAFAQISAGVKPGSSLLVVTHQENMRDLALDCQEIAIESARLKGDLKTVEKIESISPKNCTVHKFLYDKRSNNFSYCGEVQPNVVGSSVTREVLDRQVTRAVFDVGSGSLKVIVADVDPVTQKILRIHHSEEQWVPFKRDLILSGEPRFSQQVQDKGMQTFADMKARLEKYHPTEWIGVATSASRNAENASEFFEKVNRELGIKVTVIPASEEGRLGFMTAVASSGLPKENIVSLDCGSGSFQLGGEIDGKFEVVEGLFAYMTALEKLLTQLRGLSKDALETVIDGKRMTSSPNPISIDEAKTLIPELQKLLPEISADFAAKIKDPNSTIVSIGGPITIFGYTEYALGKNTFTKQELWNAIEAHCGRTDGELKGFPDYREAVLGMILLYSIMDGIGIEKLTNTPSRGSCEGLAIAEDYWASPENRITRAIFDVGSGSLKVLIADVDPISQKILQIHHSEEQWVPFYRDMLVSGQPRFSKEVQDTGMEVFADMKKRLAKYGPTEWIGVATSAGRKAQNAADFFDKVKNELGIKISVIPASEEGKLGFLTAVASSGLPKENVISFDCGGGSFQLAGEAKGKLEVVEGLFARADAHELLLSGIRRLPKEKLETEVEGKKVSVSPNPVSMEEVEKLIPLLQMRLPQISKEFGEKLKDPKSSVLGIGGDITPFAYAEYAIGKKTFTKEELWKAIQTHSGKTDSELQGFPYVKQAVTGMVLLYAIMDGVGIDKLTNAPSMGSCEGLAIDESYWEAPMTEK